jgi:hypothetical protein
MTISLNTTGLPGNEISLYIVPLGPAYLPTAGRQGSACRARSSQKKVFGGSFDLNCLNFIIKGVSAHFLHFSIDS